MRSEPKTRFGLLSWPKVRRMWAILPFSVRGRSCVPVKRQNMMVGLAVLVAFVLGGPMPAGACSGTITEYGVPTEDAGLESITLSSDGALWFIERMGNAIGRITLDGQVYEFPLPRFWDGPVAIVAGADGTAWFTEANSDRVGQITPSGDFKEWELETYANPRGLVVGPDGNFWFTEDSLWTPETLGRLTPQGVLTHYPSVKAKKHGQALYPTLSGGIAVGADGHLWFLAAVGDLAWISVMDTRGGAVTRYLVPEATAEAQGMALGADGALWYVEPRANRIGRIDEAGIVAEYAIPTADSQPHSITAGPDGALWFTEYGADKIGRISLKGEIQEYQLPAGSGPRGLARGPDGALWFTEKTNNKIGKLVSDGGTGSRGIRPAPHESDSDCHWAQE
jgi:virginiamycin B lyase